MELGAHSSAVHRVELFPTNSNLAVEYQGTLWVNSGPAPSTVAQPINSTACGRQAVEPFRASEGDQCDHCGMKLRARVAALTCAVPSCNAHCHKMQTCSRINKYAINNLEWKCKIHSAADKDGAEQAIDSAACQQASHVTIAGRDVTKLVQTASVRTEKKTCKLCKRTIASNITPVECFSCKSSFHKACLVKSGHSRDEVELISSLQEWLCSVCDSPPPAPAPSSTSTLDEAIETSQPFDCSGKSSLRILQWNADGLSTKWPELEDRLKKSNIDIPLIQETNWEQKNKAPRFQGYAPIRYDRGEGQVGGLLCLVKHNTPFVRRFQMATKP